MHDGNLPKQEWVEQSGGEAVPHQLLCIIRIEGKPRRIWLNGSQIDGPGHYALAHTAFCQMRDTGPPLHQPDAKTNEGTRAHADQDLIHWIPKAHHVAGDWVVADSQHKPSLLFVPCDAISGWVSGIPDLTTERDPPTDHFFITPNSKWGDRFVEHSVKHNRS